MNRRTEAKRVAALSPRAKALWARLCNGDWYSVYPVASRPTPKAMSELVAAGLVKRGARIKVMELAFVPHTFVSGVPSERYH